MHDAMKNKKTYYQLILDRSGSMSVCVEETVNGVNSQIRRIRELAARFPEQDLITSMSLFNHKLMPVWDRIRPNDLREITFQDYRPDGNTALLDAIGKTIGYLQANIGEEVSRNEASVVVVIFTDGYENSSHDFTHAQVASLIRELELTNKWTFSYIGATLDAVEIAINMNIQASNAIHFSVEDSVNEFNRVANSMDDYLFEKKRGNIKTNFLKQDEEGEDRT
jgi:hypothetical protein